MLLNLWTNRRENKMKPNIIFFDIDGTLLSEKTFTVPDSAKEAIIQAQDNGHLVFINTGRPILEIDDCIKELNFDGYIYADVALI